MKNILMICSAALLALTITSCKDKNAFKISGTLEHPGKIKKVFLLETDSTNGVKMVDSTNLSENGEFEFSRSAPYANRYKMRIGTTIFDLIAQNGNDINFKTDVNDAAHTYS